MLQTGSMSWHTVNLEIARTQEFPRGSVSRAYLLHVPLTELGAIDEEELAASPRRATVRRFWPSQADQSGALTKVGGDWWFCFPDKPGLRSVCKLNGGCLEVGQCLTITDQDGASLPFRVASRRRHGAVSLTATCL